MTYTIATIGSHSALQILKGAKDENFKTLAFVLRENLEFYKNYNFIDDFQVLNSYSQLGDLEKKFNPGKLIIIPHGSFVAYLGKDFDNKTSFKYFGNKKILAIEADRLKQDNWLKIAGVLTPKIFADLKDVDRPVIVKAHGAKGGLGYRLCPDKKSLTKAVASLKKEKFLIQEYITGTPVYIQYFFSAIESKLEIIGCDRRYESSIDGLGRIPAAFQKELIGNPSFTVIGNFPIVLRESLLPKIYSMGQSIIKTSKKIAPPRGLFGSFCLETVIDGNMNIYAIEISCRIVAGTNLYIQGSPYADLLYDKPVSCGRRIAMEIKKAVKINRLNKILT